MHQMITDVNPQPDFLNTYAFEPHSISQKKLFVNINLVSLEYKFDGY